MYVWLFIFLNHFTGNKNKFKGDIWFLKIILSFSLAVSQSGWDGGADCGCS